MRIITFSSVALITTLGLTGCATQEVETIGPERINLTYEELITIDGYEELLLNTCDGSLSSSLANLSFLPIGDNASGPSPSEVMKTRTLRILEAIGDGPSESRMLNEKGNWNGLENGIETTYWTSPSESVEELVVNSIEENLIPPLFRGETPINPKVKEQVLADWVEACGIAKVLSDATTITSDFENALAKLMESFESRYTSQGFEKYPDGLVKMEIVGKKINFSFVKTHWCSLDASVTFVGKPDVDGLTPLDETVVFHLDHSLEFAEINQSFDIQEVSNRTLEFHDLKSGRLTGVECW